ncbi:MAG: hypothetical protein BGO54_15705 [Sphingobacteriales bacterium 46-32]|nr:MAG: hypothetical protein BGO54_15705 [Sphingobacteriales bacterium 46-32]
MKFERLGNIVKNLDNKRIPLNSIEREAKSIDGEYPYIGANNIVGFINEYIFDEKILCVAEDGGSWGAGEQCAVIYEGKTWVNNHAHVLVENGKAYLDYIKYYLNYANLNSFITGTTRGKLTRTALDKIPIPLPNTFADQIRIATLLSKAEALINKRKEGIKLLEEYVKSVFAEMFGDPVKNERGWKKMNLSQVCNKITDGTHFSPPIVETGKPYLTAKHVRENKIDFWANPWFISEENHAEIYKRCDPKKGDVIYIKDGATTGFAAVNKYDFEFSMLSSLALLRPEINMCLPVYLCYWLNNKSVKEQVLKMMAGGAIQRLTLKKINEIKILIPPIELQKKFTKIVEKADILNDQLKISLEYLEDLYNSISQKAFKGDLDLNRIKSKVIDEKIEKLLKGRKQAGIVDKQPKTDEEDTSYGDPFEVDEVTAKKQGAWFYNEWLRLHGKTIEEENESVWLQSKRSGLRPTTIKFNSLEGNAIINEVFSKQNTGFGFSEFESALKTEKIAYTAKEIKEFIFQKLEQKELVQYYATKEWMEAIRHPKFNPPGGPEFSGEGSIWFLVNKTDKAK